MITEERKREIREATLEVREGLNANKSDLGPAYQMILTLANTILDLTEPADCECGEVFRKSGDTQFQALINKYHTAMRRASMWRRRAELAESKVLKFSARRKAPEKPVAPEGDSLQ